jgi:hypothetical protein
MQFAFRGVLGTLVGCSEGLLSTDTMKVAVFVIWVVVVSALLFGVDAFIERTQAARHVGDGAVNICKWIVMYAYLS